MKKYYPALISKSGEIDALRLLDQPNKNTISPIIELIPEGIDFNEVEKNLSTHWSFNGNQVLIDYSRFKDSGSLSKIESLLKVLKSKGVNVVPVLSRTSIQDQTKIAKSFLKKNAGDLCIRVSDKNGGFIGLNESVLTLLKEMELEASRIILILDFGYVLVNTVKLIAAFAINTIKALPDAKSWKGIVVLSGSFPKDLSDFEVSDTPHIIQRQEEVLFGEIISNQLDFVKYGDYGTKHPDYVPSGKYSASCSVKYSTKTSFVIYRGNISKKHKLGNGQYIVHSNNLKDSDHYSGESFCWGDQEIMRISKEDIRGKRPKTGNAESWVKISWSHHMTLINSL